MDADLQKQVVEALIFASDAPISENKIAAMVEDVTPKQVEKIVAALNREYSQSRRAFFIQKVAGGFQIHTQSQFAPWIKKLFKGRAKPRLSQAGLEALAIIAFKQPISRVAVDAIRGVHSGGVIKNLLERNLICIAGRSEGQGKPLLYGTTKEFLGYIGINDISELPRPREIEEIMGKVGEGQMSEELLQALTEVEEDEQNGQEQAGEQPSNGQTE